MSGFLLLAACSSATTLDPVTPQRTAASQPPVPAPAPAPSPPAAPPRAVVADQCGAKDLQGLIGRPRTEVPVPVRPELERVVCNTCMMTMDYVPNRLTIVFDATTGLIKEVRCG